MILQNEKKIIGQGRDVILMPIIRLKSEQEMENARYKNFRVCKCVCEMIMI